MSRIRIAHKNFEVAKDANNILQFDNVFSDRFSAYEIIGHNISAGENPGTIFSMSLIGADGNVITTSSYYSVQTYGYDNVTTSTTSVQTGTYFRYFSRVGEEGSSNFQAVIHTPYESDKYTSFFNTCTQEISGWYYSFVKSGIYQNAERVTGFRLYSDNLSYEIEAGNVSVFGIGG